MSGRETVFLHNLQNWTSYEGSYIQQAIDLSAYVGSLMGVKISTLKQRNSYHEALYIEAIKEGE